MPKQNPFSLYDFLGYLIPGYASLLLCRLYLSLFLPPCQIPPLDINSASTAELINIAILSYVAGHLFNYLSSITVEHYSINTIGYPTGYLLDNHTFKSYFDVKDKPFQIKRKILRTIITAAILPIYAIDTTLDKTLSIRHLYAKNLDSFLVDTINKKILEMLALEGIQNQDAIKNKDIHRLIYHYITEHSVNHFNKAQNYVAIYGLLRSFALLSSLLTIFLLAQSIQILLEAETYKSLFSRFDLIALISSFSISYLFYLAFVKFYRRFTLESLMALTAIISTKSRNESKQINEA
ncbi:hypothetical protein [Chromobacterium vaccinii]|uniref:hypothetical protein n=1 Tax=Chromobacterium vaccinii TaxID=1108595 RepID=UPI000AB3287A|nr:hypothetical protein [Chromobacterium vaccinii]